MCRRGSHYKSDGTYGGKLKPSTCSETVSIRRWSWSCTESIRNKLVGWNVNTWVIHKSWMVNTWIGWIFFMSRNTISELHWKKDGSFRLILYTCFVLQDKGNNLVTCSSALNSTMLLLSRRVRIHLRYTMYDVRM